MIRRFTQRVLAHIASGEIEVFTLTDYHYAAAEQLLCRYAFEYRLRTLDALHLAVASDLRSRNLLGFFIAFDRGLCEVAALEDDAATAKPAA